MADNLRYNHFVIFTIILIIGVGFALTLPWLANAQGLNAKNEVSEQSNAPEAITTTYYVAITGTGQNPTVDWSGAFTNVQDALVVAVEPSEIWVAEGVYYPDVGTGQTDNDETSTFVLTDGVALYGGFAFGATDISDRDWDNNITVLSGDIDWDNGGMDVIDPYGVVITTTNIISDNAYHVVSAIGVTGTAKLDGFTITAGKADSSKYPNGIGGGFFCDGFGSGNTCNPSLKNIKFSGNLANLGGAMFNQGFDGISSPSLTNVTFSGNSAGHGGAMYNQGHNGTSSPILSGVFFSGNSAVHDGGAMNNYSYDGGNSSPRLTNVIFSGNSTGFDGGAMYNEGKGGDSNPTLTNVIFSGNKASTGGAMFNKVDENGKCNPTLTNVTISGNSAVSYGGAMVNYAISGISTPDVYNSILWNNLANGVTETTDANIFNYNASISLTHSLVVGSGGSGEGWIGGDYKDGLGNIDENPLFVDPVSPSSASSTNGDLRLGEGSPAIDMGENSYTEDTGVQTDLAGEERFKDGDGDGDAVVDMGAYEAKGYYHLTVSKSGGGSGTVSSTPAGIDCGDTCSDYLLESTTITLTAVPDKGSTFVGWSGDCTGSTSCIVTMDKPRNVTANFEVVPYQIYQPLVFR